MSRPRITGGSAKGRALLTPQRGTRPSPSRLREALFDVLAFEPRERFLDLYSGSGAIGLEAASRGFPATCVELSRAAVKVIEKNASELGLPVEVVRGDALAYASSHPDTFGVVFAAPPYPLDLDAVFSAVASSGAAVAGGAYVLQHPSQLDPAIAHEPKWREVRRYRYGSNSITLLRVPVSSQGESPAPPAEAVGGGASEQ